MISPPDKDGYQSPKMHNTPRLRSPRRGAPPPKRKGFRMNRVGIIGAGWPGTAHAKGYLAAGGFRLVAVADLIPARRTKLLAECGIQREYASADELLKDKELDVVSICLPNHLHVTTTLAALKAG